jgi:hypothetical protein
MIPLEAEGKDWQARSTFLQVLFFLDHTNEYLKMNRLHVLHHQNTQPQPRLRYFIILYIVLPPYDVVYTIRVFKKKNKHNDMYDDESRG